MITIKNEKQMKKYYVKKVNTYMFEDDVEFLCNINVEANIIAWDINAKDILAWNVFADDITAKEICVRNINAWCINADNITADNIKAEEIIAHNIIYYAICVAYNNIECNSINGRRANAKHFVLDGELIVGGNKK